jgi:hypothetical protein
VSGWPQDFRLKRMGTIEPDRPSAYNNACDKVPQSLKTRNKGSRSWSLYVYLKIERMSIEC